MMLRDPEPDSPSPSAAPAPGGSRPSAAEQTLQAWLDRLRSRWRLLTRLGVAARVVGVLAAVVLLAWVADRLVEPVGLALVGLYALAALIGIAGAVLLRRPLHRVPTDRQLARLAEERDGSLDDVVVTATERMSARQAGQAGPLDGLVVRAAAERLQAIEPDRVIERSTMSRAWRWALAAGAVFLVSAGVGWGPAWRALQTARLYVSPPRIDVQVQPGNARVARGSALRVSAVLAGLPSGATPEPPVLRVTEQGGGTTEIRMRADGGRFVADWPAVAQALRYRVSSGTLPSPEFQVAALDAARVTRIDVDYAFPAFTRLAPRHDEDAGDIFGPAGTQVTVRVHTDKPVARGALSLRDGAPVALARDGAETTLSANLTLERDGAYRIGLTDVDGLISPEGTEYFIRILDDRPPDVRIMRPAGDRQVTRLEEIVIEAQADDDHGVSGLELVYAVKGATEKVVPLHRAPRDAQSGSTSVTGAHTLYVEELDVVPGDFITYYARARDVSRGKRSTEARSDIFFLEVRPFTEEFFAAQSQAMMGGGGGQAADLLEAQKEIIVATWKLQRRAIAGQSAADVKAVGKAQGDLRKRAEQMASQMARAFAPPRRRSRQAVPEPAPQAEANPLARATASMARAETALNGLKPNEAVPHEMAAYNELLKLQAENTQRQVSRQRGGGGGGGRSGNQDLSALFDEELLRQQETNYENRDANGGGNQEQARDETLEKLKELARRQDEIAQRQRELARARAALPQEEVKRRLERLTREQEELRRQTEALSQQMARQARDGQQSQQASGQSGQSQSQGSQGQSASGQSRGSQAQQAAGEGSQQLRELAEQMAGTAHELSQNNLDAAQQRAEQARDRLRELEQRLGGEAVPDEGRRAFGELQLESQQIAEAQRRLATESRQLEAGGDRPGGSDRDSRSGRGQGQAQAGTPATATRDALRRLAAEQERLAQRAAELDKRLQSVTRQRGGEEAAKAAAGARDAMAKGQLAEEMRRTAEALRRAGAPGAEAQPRATGRGPGQPPQGQPDARGAADRTEALARAAATVAERLGAPANDSPEARQLAEQLAQLRGLRERMSDIEGRLREAVQRAAASEQAGQNGRQAGARGQQPGQQPGQGQTAGQSQSQQAQAGQPGGRSDGQGGGQGGGNAGEIGRLQSEYDAALRETRQLMDGISRQGGNGRQAGAMATPEQHEFSRSAPGTEAFKQDYAKWESLNRNVTNALEAMEASLAQRLSERAARDRVNAGGDERVPAQYSDSVSRYYRSLARRPPE